MSQQSKPSPKLGTTSSPAQLSELWAYVSFVATRSCGDYSKIFSRPLQVSAGRHTDHGNIAHVPVCCTEHAHAQDKEYEMRSRRACRCFYRKQRDQVPSCEQKQPAATGCGTGSQMVNSFSRPFLSAYNHTYSHIASFSSVC